MSVEGNKVSKDSKEAKYLAPEEGPFYCGGCVFYLDRNAESSPCAKVKGIVERLACCNLYSKYEDEDEDGE